MFNAIIRAVLRGFSIQRTLNCKEMVSIWAIEYWERSGQNQECTSDRRRGPTRYFEGSKLWWHLGQGIHHVFLAFLSMLTKHHKQFAALWHQGPETDWVVGSRQETSIFERLRNVAYSSGGMKEASFEYIWR